MLDLIGARGWRWSGRAGVGLTTSPGPQPLRSAEKHEADWEPPAERTMPFGFNLPVPEPTPDPDTEAEPLLYEGDNA